VDLILVTHAHVDHIGDAPDLAKKHNVPIFAPGGLNQTLLTARVAADNLVPRMNRAGPVTPLGPDIRSRMTGARSTRASCSGRTRHRQRTRARRRRSPGGFIIEFENGFKVYQWATPGCSATCAGSANTTSPT